MTTGTKEEARGEEGGAQESQVPEPETLEQFEARCAADEAYRNQYLENPHDERFEKFNVLQAEKMNGGTLPQEEYSSDETPPEAPQGTEESQQQQSSEQARDEEITLTIPKSALGTYLTGREAPEAVLEALKGKKAADEYILKLRQERDKYQQDLIAMQQAGIPAAPKPPQGEEEKPEEGLLNEEEFQSLDLFDPDNQEKLTKQLAAANRRISKLEGNLTKALEATTQITTRQQQEATRSLQQNRIQQEFQEIADLQAIAPELKTARPISDIDRDVTEFYKRIEEASPEQGDQAIRLYFSQTSEGEALRNKLSAMGVAPPEDYDKHQQIMGLRGQRLQDHHKYVKQLSRQLGRELKPEEVPMHSSSNYVSYWNAIRSSQPPAGSAAAAPPQPPKAPTVPPKTPQGAPEVPQGVGVPNLGPENMSEQELQALATKDLALMSREEAQILMRLYREMNIPAPPDLTVKAGMQG